MTTNTTIAPELLDQLLANYGKPEDLSAGYPTRAPLGRWAILRL